MSAQIDVTLSIVTSTGKHLMQGDVATVGNNPYLYGSEIRRVTEELTEQFIAAVNSSLEA